MVKTLQNIVVLSITFVITFGALELGLRQFMPVDYRPPASELAYVAGDVIYQASAVPGLDYELVPDFEGQAHGVLATTNAEGMRDAPPDPLKPHIVVLGDSFTFGFKVPQDQTFPHLLEQELQAQGQDYDVLNLAVAGYALKDEVLALEYKGMPWEPDVIIVGYVLNDPEIEPIQEIPAYFREAEWWQYSHVLRLFARGYKRAQILLEGDGDYYRYLHADKTSWASVVNGFAGIKAMAAAGDARVIVLIFPDLWYDWENYPYRDIHGQVADLAVRNGFTVIDLTDEFSAYPPAELRVEASDAHPNAIAHRLTTQAILEVLAEKQSLGQ